MAVDIERLVVQLSADVKQYQNAMNKAMGITNRQTRAIETRFSKMNKNLAGSFALLNAKLVGVFAAAGGIRGAQALLDASTRIQNALKVTGLEGDALIAVYDRLFASAQKNAAPLEDLVTLYSRASMAAANLGASQEDLLKFTNNVGLALRVSGKSAQEASGALLQLSQLLGGNVVQAQEYNSLIDGAYPLLQAVAAGLREAGGDVGRLTQLVKSGKVPTKAFFDAFQTGGVILEEKVATSTQTVSAGFVKIYNALIDAVGKIDGGTDSSKKLSLALDQLATSISNFDISVISDELGAMSRDISRTIDDWNRWLKAYREVQAALANGDIGGAADAAGGFFLDTTTAEDKIEGLEKEVEALQAAIANNTELGFDNTEALARLDEVRARIAQINAAAAGGAAANPSYRPGTPGDPNALAQKPTLGKAGVDPVSLKDYKLDDKDKKGGKGEKDFPREVRQIQERTAALKAETAAMAGLNPLINDYGFALEKASAVQELLSSAKKQGLEITPKLEAQIDQLATAYASANAAAEQLAESQDELRESFEEMRDLGKDVMGGFIHDLIEGKSATDALAGALAKVGDKLLEIAMNDLWGKSGSGGLGILGSLFGMGGGTTKFAGDIMSGARVGLFHKGGVVGAPGGQSRVVSPSVFAGAPRYHDGGVAGMKPGEIPAILKRGEVVLPKMPKIASGGGASISAPVSIQIDARGADREGLARVEQQVARLKAEIPARVVQGVREANKKNVKFG